MKPSGAKLHELALQLADLQKRAKTLGVFTNDREMLECPRCGLLEDVTSTGLLITCRAAALTLHWPEPEQQTLLSSSESLSRYR